MQILYMITISKKRNSIFNDNTKYIPKIEVVVFLTTTSIYSMVFKSLLHLDITYLLYLGILLVCLK